MQQCSITHEIACYERKCTVLHHCVYTNFSNKSAYYFVEVINGRGVFTS